MENSLFCTSGLRPKIRTLLTLWLVVDAGEARVSPPVFYSFPALLDLQHILKVFIILASDNTWVRETGTVLLSPFYR